MPKESKKAAADEPSPKKPRRKKGAATLPLNGDGESTPTPADTPEAEAAEPANAVPAESAAAETPRKKRGKKKSAETEALPPAESAPDESAAPETPPVVAEAENTPAPDTVDAEAMPVLTPAAPEEPAPPPLNEEELLRTLEALLFAAEEPLPVREMARAAGSDSPTVRKMLPKLKEKYDGEKRAWDVAEVGAGWRLVTRPEFYGAIQRLKKQTLQKKLTQAGLETLALIAYRQPISRAEVENVRGVGAGPVLRQLLERKLVHITGRGTGLGQPLLYGTTDYFLEHFGLRSLQDLPKPGEFKA